MAHTSGFVMYASNIQKINSGGFSDHVGSVSGNDPNICLGQS